MSHHITSHICFHSKTHTTVLWGRRRSAHNKGLTPCNLRIAERKKKSTECVCTKRHSSRSLRRTSAKWFHGPVLPPRPRVTSDGSRCSKAWQATLSPALTLSPLPLSYARVYSTGRMRYSNQLVPTQTAESTPWTDASALFVPYSFTPTNREKTHLHTRNDVKMKKMKWTQQVRAFFPLAPYVRPPLSCSLPDIG